MRADEAWCRLEGGVRTGGDTATPRRPMCRRSTKQDCRDRLVPGAHRCTCSNTVARVPS